MKQVVYNNNKLSKLSLGTVQFGLDYGIANSGGQPTQEEVNEIIDYVYDNNINCFDTAQAYGTSEQVLGESVKTKKDIFIISKLKSDLFQNNLEMNIDNSLNNLNINCLYGLLLHDSELLYTWTQEYTSLVEKLIDDNKIKNFGVSIYTNEDFELALDNDSIKFIQIPFNIFDQRAISQQWFQKAKAKNKLIFIRSIFLQGLLLMDIDKVPSNLLKAKKYLIKIDEYCEKLNITKNELALSFVDTIATESLMLFGCDNISQAKDNISTYNRLKFLDKNIILNMIDDFKNIDEDIYNPTKWNV
jgi:aryl-alcohol dehydrogenase-like predicted oxidoreductase